MKANKLSCKDFMIGDWVYNTHNRQNERVQEICNVFVMLDYNDLYEYDEIEPIPLTPEILEKNGFKEYDGLYRLDIAKGVFVNADFKSKEPFVSIHNTCYRATPICIYLHQLQHALRLCGVTLNIEL